MEKEKQFDCSGFDMMEEGYFGEQGVQFTAETDSKTYVYHNWSNCKCESLKEEISKGNLKLKEQDGK